MIQYSNLTLGKLMTDVIVGLQPYRTPENIDSITLTNIINSSIYEVLMTTLPFKDWAYTSRLDVINGTRLPIDYIRKIRVMLRNPLDELGFAFTEARYIDPREWYTVTTQNQMQQFNRATTIRPVYTIWGDRENIPYRFAPANINQLTIYISPAIMVGYFDCHLHPAKVALPTDVIFIPTEYEAILLNTVKIKVLGKFGLYKEAKELYGFTSDILKGIKQSIDMKGYTEKRAQESFVEKVLPYTQPEPLPEQNPDNIGAAAPQNGGPRGD